MAGNEELTLPTAQRPPIESLVWDEEMELCLSNPELIWSAAANEELPAGAAWPAEKIQLPATNHSPAHTAAQQQPAQEDNALPGQATDTPTVNISAQDLAPTTTPTKGIVEFISFLPKPTGGPELAELVATRAELKRLEERFQQVEKLRWELSNSLTRHQNDFSNYRRRVEQEREDLRQYLLGEILAHFLPVVDNLKRAQATVTHHAPSHTTPQLSHGLELIAQQCEEILAGFGLYPVPALGERFDPSVHEAVALEPTNEVPPDTVTQELLRGYQLGHKLLRAAIVKVAVKP